MTDTNKKIPADVYAFMRELVQESLRDWFKKEKWVRISSSGNIAGPCGTSKNKKNPDRCLPKAKAQSLTKGQRAATAQKKKKAGSKGKTVVKNTKKATVKKEGFKDFLKRNLFSKDAQARMREKDLLKRIIDTQKKYYNQRSQQDGMYMAALHMVTIFGQENDKQGVEYAQAHVDKKRKKYGSRMNSLDSDVEYRLDNLKENIARNHNDKAAPFGSGYKKADKFAGSDPKAGSTIKGTGFDWKKVTKEDIRNLVVGLLHESQNPNFKVLEKGPYYRYLPTDDLFTDLNQLGHHGLQRSPDNLAVYKTADELLDVFEDMYYEDPERAIAWAEQNDDIVKFLGTNETLTEKDDRCTRLAKQKYDTWPSAYASGAVVRCRRGEIWKKEK